MLPFGVVIPSKNSLSYLPAHVAGLKPWLDLAAEVVVVDSFSTDGTMEYLQKNLSHPNITFSSHPPGLYASWNHGISQIRSPYFFMATTGDLITREGIIALVNAAEKLDCDVVISKPTFRDQEDRPLPDRFWPVDDIINTLGITAPRKLKKLEAVVFAAANPTGAILGSSASNLYRTETFRRLPFPTNFGAAGDAGWAWMHAAEVSFGVLPGKYSSFLVHPNNLTQAEKKSYEDASPPHEVMRAALVRWRESGVINDEEFKLLDWEGLMTALEAYRTAKTTYDQNRHASFPWILNPVAWRNRVRRDQLARLLKDYKLRMAA